MSTHLCLTCRHAMWQRNKSGRLTGVGFCEAPDPELPALPATKWWAFTIRKPEVNGGYLDRRTANSVEQCHFYDKAKS